MILELENRLEKLAFEVSQRRRQGFVQKWSDEIKSEALYLVEKIGKKRVSEITKLTLVSLNDWKINLQANKIKNILLRAEEQIAVTRIVANSNKNILKRKRVIASLVKEKVELKIYCKVLAEKITERFLQCSHSLQIQIYLYAISQFHLVVVMMV